LKRDRYDNYDFFVFVGAVVSHTAAGID